MEKMEHEILMTAMEMFGKYGLKPVTMDDLAGELNISKKTLYKYVKNKQDLVQQTVKEVFTHISQHMHEVKATSEDAIDELFKLDEVVCSTVENYNHSLQFQLKRYYPEIHGWLEGKRKDMVLGLIGRNIKNGVREGLYRPDLNQEIITLLYYSRMVVLIGEEIEPFKNYDTKEVMREILVYHIRGMATAQGLEKLEQRLKLNTENEKN